MIDYKYMMMSHLALALNTLMHVHGQYVYTYDQFSVSSGHMFSPSSVADE
jgi:hypothetical protein